MRIDPRDILDGRFVLRPVEPADRGRYLRYRRANREAFRPFEPRRHPDAETEAGIAEWVQAALRDLASDRRYSFVIVERESPDMVGHLNFNNVVRGAFQSTNLGYAMDARYWGRGIMTAAVAAAIDVAFHDLDLHRVEAAILPDNAASVAVVSKNDFTEEGFARFYLAIDGAWRDHRIFARTNPERPIP